MQTIGFSAMNEALDEKLKKNILQKRHFSINLSSLTGIVISSYGSALIWESIVLAQTMDYKGTTGTSRTRLPSIN